MLDSTHNATALGGTWSTGSGAVITGSVEFIPFSFGRYGQANISFSHMWILLA